MTRWRGWYVAIWVVLIAAALQFASAWWGLRANLTEDEEWLFWSDVSAGAPPRWVSPAWPEALSMFRDEAFRAALAKDRFDALWASDRVEYVIGGRASGMTTDPVTRRASDSRHGTTWSTRSRPAKRTESRKFPNWRLTLP